MGAIPNGAVAADAAHKEKTKILSFGCGPQPFCGTDFEIHNCPQISLGCPQSCGIHNFVD